MQTKDYLKDTIIDSETIIKAVQKCRPIWDLEHEGYHNKSLKDDAWNSVCFELISDWNALCEGEKYIRQMEFKKKWNNIRDYYKKLLSETRTSEQEVRAKKRRYLYSDILEFIRPVYDKRRTEVTNHSNESNTSSQFNNVESDEHQDSDKDTQDALISSPTKKKVPKRLVNLRKTVIRPDQCKRRPPAKTNKSSPMTIFERTVIKSLDKISAPKDDDADLAFLKSLLPDMKKLTSTQKFDFKLGIMELYRNISHDQSDVDPDPHAIDQSVDHDHNSCYDLDLKEGRSVVKVETVRLSDDDDLYHSS